MLAIELFFMSGRFHATPWGRHVNEGVPEWPPSPWRLLRALVAIARRTVVDLGAEELRSVLEPLTGAPSFVLPSAAVAHSRHYMPWGKKGPADRTLVFDTFIALDPAIPVVVIWPESCLTDDHRSVLTRLLENLNRLGRAESWCSARLLDETSAREQLTKSNCRPSGDSPTDRNAETLRVLCPDPTSAFENDHTPTTAPSPNRKKGDSKPPRAIYDPDWHLCLETLDIHDRRWSSVPGSCWVAYRRRVDSSRPRQAPARPSSRPLQTVARFSIDEVTLPLIQRTLPIADQCRRALMGLYSKIAEREKYGEAPPPTGERFVSEVLSGKNASGDFLTGHGHAYYLPTDEDRDGRIDHLTIVAARGFDATVVRALDQLRELRLGPGQVIKLMLVGLGTERDLNAPLFRAARTWQSVTPFLVTRYPKRRGRKRDQPELLGRENEAAFVEAVLREELDRLCFRRPEVPKPSAVFHLAGVASGTRRLRGIEFERSRRKSSDDGGRRMSGTFRVEFPALVSGPIALGHSSHFGLGLFLPAD